jgi:EAL domain-containing protein (putative c-di-GMP-specific phosphodiesterase class I)
MGTVIFHEGQVGDKAYIVDSGEIAVSTRVNDQDIQFALSRRGDVVGEMALIDDGLRTATATALSDAELIVIPKEYIQRLLKASDPTVDLLIKLILQRYREMKSHFDRISRGETLDFILDSAPSQVSLKLREQANLAASRVKEEQRLREALHNRELVMYYQPIVEIKSGAIAGCEALIRWQDPEKGLIPPLQFIGLAEETGLIEPIGHWIFAEAGRMVQQWQQRVAPSQPFFVGVNLSSRQIETTEQVDDLMAFLQESRIPLDHIKVEITESLLMSNPLHVSRVLNNLKQLGCDIALDDFGTGYSSFSYLHRFPIDTIKIDRSFVATMHDNPKSHAIVRTICGLADSLDMKTVGEGVEYPEDDKQLREFGCIYGQGYHYAKPIPEADFLQLLQPPLTAKER